MTFSVTENTDLDEITLVNQPQLKKALSVSDSTLWRIKKDPEFPKPFYPTGRHSPCWRIADIRAWIDKKYRE